MRVFFIYLILQLLRKLLQILNTLISFTSNTQKAMKQFTLIILAFLTIYTSSKAQNLSFPAGKYLVLMTDFGDDEPDEGKMVMEINKDGILLALSPNKKQSATPLAQLSVKEEKINIEFIPRKNLN